MWTSAMIFSYAAGLADIQLEINIYQKMGEVASCLFLMVGHIIKSTKKQKMSLRAWCRPTSFPAQMQLQWSTVVREQTVVQILFVS